MNRKIFHLTKFFLSFGLLFLFVCSAAAQNYRFDVWTTNDGLPQNTVNGLVQTTDGYIWFTTNDGIVRFDGVRFKVFNKSNTENLPVNRFGYSFLDKSGVLWFKSEIETLVKYEKGIFTSYDLTGGLPVKVSTPLYDDGQGNILFGNVNGEHFHYVNGKFEPFKIPGGDGKAIIVHTDREGGIWVLEGENILRLINGRTESFGLKKIDKSYVFPIYQDRSGNFWMQDEKAYLIRLRGGEKQLFPYEVVRLDDFLEDTDGNLWITGRKGLLRISAAQIESAEILPDEIKNFTTADGLSDNTIMSVLQDSEGGIWAGTLKGGLIHITKQAVKVYSKEDWKTEDENVYPILESREGDIWLGVWERSIVKYSPNSKFAAYKTDQLTANPSALFEDSGGRLLIANRTNLFYFEDGKFTEIEPPANIRFIGIVLMLEDSGGNLWLGSDKGLIRYKNGEAVNFTKQDGLPNDTVTSMIHSTNGGFWIGTTGGIALYKNGQFTSYTEKDGLVSNYVRSLYEESDGVLWIGTYDGGLSRFKDGEFSNFTAENGMFSNNVFCILEDEKGWFWMNSNRGIYRINKQQLNDFADGKIDYLNSIAYTEKDGLLSSEGNGGKQPAGIIRSNGELWFPTIKGVAVINPKEIAINPNPPPVRLEEISVDRKEIDNYGEKIELQPGQSNLQINYTGLSFVNSPLVKFRYRMEGLEENWNDVGTRRVAYYNNLPPGSYTFHVLAANRDGVWNEEGATIKIVVRPYFYQTYWFYALAFLTFAAIFLLIYFYRVSNLKRIASARTAFAEQLIESQEAERKRIASELHDGLGQTLAMIRNRAIFSSEDLDDLRTAEEQFGIINEQTGQAIGEVREIAYNLRPYLLERLGLTKALTSLVNKTAEANKLKFIQKIDDVDGLFSPKDEMSIYRIVQESLSNILKHAEADELSVKIEKKDSHLHILVQDNGKGFDINAPTKSGGKNGGFGFVSLTERVRMLGGIQQIESEIGNGTKIIVSIELSQENKNL